MIVATNKLLAQIDPNQRTIVGKVKPSTYAQFPIYQVKLLINNDYI